MIKSALSKIILAIISSASAAFKLSIASASPVAAFSISSRCSFTKSFETKSLDISSNSPTAFLVPIMASAYSSLVSVLCSKISLQLSPFFPAFEKLSANVSIALFIFIIPLATISASVSLILSLKPSILVAAS